MRELRLRLSRSAFAVLGVEELLALLDGCDTVCFRSLSCRGSAGTCMLEADAPLDADDFEALEYVDTFELVGHGPDRFEYLLRMELPRCRDELDEREGEFYVDGPVHFDDDGLTFTAIATQEALDDIDGTFGGMNEMRPHLEILRIRTYTGRTGRVEMLTDRQREVLTTAFERDYFEVPRGVTADELAAEFDLDKSTVLEHLRRAERNLLENRFDTGGTARTW